MSSIPPKLDDLLDDMHFGMVNLVGITAFRFPPQKRLLFVGSGIGGFARWTAWSTEASELHMVDFAVEPDEFEPFCPEHYYKVDVLSEEFVYRLAGKVDNIVCIHTVHELAQPLRGVINILRLLPKDGCSIAWFTDLSAHRWREMATEDLSDQPKWAQAHNQLDLANVARHKLNDDECVENLYKEAALVAGHEKCDYKLLGQPGVFYDNSFNGTIYEVLISNPAPP